MAEVSLEPVELLDLPRMRMCAGNHNVRAAFVEESSVRLIQIAGKTLIDPNAFYEETLLAFGVLSLDNFEAESDGYGGNAASDVDILITGIESRAIVLRTCHVVWALQRSAEMIYEEERYTELQGIVYASRITRMEDIVAIYEVVKKGTPISTFWNQTSRARLVASGPNKTAAIAARSSQTERGTYPLTSPDRPAKPPDIFSLFQPNRSTEYLNSTPYKMTIYKLPGSRGLLPEAVFLTAIRGLARLSEYAADSQLRTWYYSDDDLRVICTLQSLGEKATSAHLTILGFIWLVKDMIEHDDFTELAGELRYETPAGVITKLGFVEIRRFNPLQQVAVS